jgi:GNAT superfamily N-acetyltransferase
MTDEVIMRQYQEGDEKEIVNLLELAFNKWPNFDLNCTPLEHWQWKFRDNPQDKLIMFLAVIEGQIVACHHQLLNRMRIGSQNILCSIGVDVAVHPDHRRKGIRRLVRGRYDIKKKAGVKFRLNIIPYPYAIQFQERTKSLSLPYGTTLFTRIRDINLFLEHEKPKHPLSKKYGFYISRITNRLSIIFSRSQRSSLEADDINIVEAIEFDNRINSFWNVIKDQYDFIIERNRDYLNWRYCDSRGGEYIVKIAERESKILGYIVLRKKRNEL